MALISCPECSQQISDKAQACPHCGCPAELQELPMVDFRAQFPHPGLMPFIPGMGNLTLSGRKLGKMFAQMGTIEGRTFDEIVQVVGTPQSQDVQAFGQMLCQWIKPPFHVGIMFDQNGVCGGLTHLSQ